MKKTRSCHSITILVVDDDTTCLSLVAALLKKLKYEVVTAKHPNDALCALRIKGGAFDLVVSDVNMPDMNGFELQEAIAHEFNLPVVLMSVDSKEVVVSKGKKSGAAFFISKPVSPNDLKDLWQFASMRKNLNSKRKPASASEAGCKKPKVIWTNALHCRFLEAIRAIGLHRSVPKKILEVMNVPGLTRENVASHLQKYRIFLKRVSDASCKLEFGGDEGFLSNYSSSSSTASNSLLMLNKLQDFGDFPAADTPRFSCRVPPYGSLMDRSHQGGLTTGAVDFDASSISNQTNYTDFCSDEWQNMSIVGLDQLPQCLGDSCFVGDYQDDHLLLQPSNLVQEQSQLCSMENLPAFDVMATQQPLENLCDEVKFQNLVQNGCEYDYTASFFIYGGMNYNDQPFYQDDRGSGDCVEFGTTSQFNKAIEQQGGGGDDSLESLLAYGLFGEDEVQTLEGI